MRVSDEQSPVIDFTFVGDHVRVRPGRRAEIIVADELTDPCPGHPAEVEQ